MIYGERVHFPELDEDGLVADFVCDEAGEIVYITFLMEDERLMTVHVTDLQGQRHTLH